MREGRASEAGAFYRRFGVAREAWFWQETPQGAFIIAVTEADDPEEAAREYAEADEPFESWFKAEALRLTGVNLNEAPLGPASEKLFEWVDRSRAASDAARAASAKTADGRTSEEAHVKEENRALIRRWFEEVWNKGREEAVDEMFAADGLGHGLAEDGGPLQGPENFKLFHRAFRGAFPDIRVTVEDVLADGDRIAARCSVRATHTGDHLGFAATGKPVEITGITICRIGHGQIIESWNNFDFLKLYQQLGVAAPAA